MKKIIYFLMFLVCVSFVSGMGNPAAAYCGHMGYKLEFVFENEDSKSYCVFDNENKCEEWKFYEGSCGQEYVKEIPCRKIGEAVFVSFEKCCEGGYVYAPKYLIGQSTCQSLSKVIFENLRYTPLYWLLSIIIILIASYFVYKRYKK